MADATLTVPAKYAEDFRAAMVHEIEFDAKGVKQERRTVLRAIEERRENVDARQEDLKSNMRLLSRSAQFLTEVGLDGEGDIQVRSADYETLAHVCETMAREVVASRLRDQLCIGPMDERQAGELRELVVPLTWAIDRAAEFHSKAWEQQERERGEVD